MLIEHVRAPKGKRLEAISAETTRLVRSSGEIPLVATKHINGFNLFAWNAAKKHWVQTQIDTGTTIALGAGWDYSLASLTPSQSPLAGVLKIGGCHRLGLAAGNERVFLIHKELRQEHLSIDLFSATGADTLKRETTDSFPIRFAAFTTGYYLWAGFDQPRNRLLVLTQTFPEQDALPRLTLLSVDAGLEFEQYKDVSRWGVQDFGLGGYDLDAVLIDNDLHCIFRQNEYPIAFALDQADRFGKLVAAQADYTPLTYLKYNLTGDVVDVQDDLPGGEHPQLQNFYPLAYTADRLSVGTLTPKQPKLTYDVKTSRKHLFLQIGGDWTETRLMQFSETKYFRSSLTAKIQRWALDPMFYFPSSGNTLQLVRPYALLPAYAVRFEWSDDQGLELDLVHHHGGIQALVMTRIQHHPLETPDDDPGLDHFAVLNINHESIPPAESAPKEPPTGAENLNFEPLFLKEDHGPQTENWSARQNVSVLNSTGWNLAAERRQGVPASFVSIHSADDGARLIYDFDPSHVTPIENKPRSLDPDAVVGCGSGEWKNLPGSPLPMWVDINLPVDDLDTLLDKSYGATFFYGLDKQILGVFNVARLGLFDNLQLSNRGKLLVFEEPLPVSNPSEAEEALQTGWDSIWDVREQILTDSPLAETLTLTVEFSNYEFTWEGPPKTPRRKVTINLRSSYQLQFHYLRQLQGQGRIEAQLPLRITCPDIQFSFARFISGTVDVDVHLGCKRIYTPAILTRDVRSENDDGSDGGDTIYNSNSLDNLAMVFTTKPLGNSSYEFTQPPTVRFSGGGILGSLFGGLVESQIRGGIENYDFKPTMDASGLLRNAGEGLAEVIAYQALTKDERTHIGLNRYKQIWKMVFVTDQLCKIFRENPA
jgi:hypothetical protein